MGIKKKAIRKTGILLDTIKGFLIIVVVFILISTFASLIVHNILRFGEVSSKYSGEYKKLYPVKSGMMNLYTIGQGDRTIVILPGVGVTSPVLEYKAIAQNLSNNFRVVIVEYFGYGFSLKTDEERTNEKMVEEIRKVLNRAEINGPYILMPFTTSNLYAMYYSQTYPNEVLGIISLDGIYPAELANTNFKNDYLPNLKTNTTIYSILSFAGLFRWESYVMPSKFNIDDMQNSKYYGKTEIKLYRNLLANKFLTKPMRNEINKLQKNMEELEEYKYPKFLQVLQILSDDKNKDCVSRGEDIDEISKSLVTNEDYQHTEMLKDSLSDYLFVSPRTIRDLVNTYF